MRRVSRRLAAVFILAVLLAPAASADTGELSLWDEFVVWTQARLGVPIGVASEDISFEDWLVLMARLGVPIG